LESSFNIRSIAPNDNAEIARIIRACLKEFGADKPGTVYYEESTDRLFEVFREKKSAYFIAEHNGIILGGGGIFPSPGLPNRTCEMVKMYLLPESRGKGLGVSLINKCLDTAKQLEFNTVYIESMLAFDRAIALYKKYGFKKLSAPLGNTGHYSEVWMTKSLSQ
jgi:putative acetyltransferase